MQQAMAKLFRRCKRFPKEKARQNMAHPSSRLSRAYGKLGELRFSNKAREFRSSGWDGSRGKDGPSDSPETSEETDPKTIIVYVKDGISA